MAVSWCITRDIRHFVYCLICDNSGTPSLAKVNLLVGAVIASVVVLKATWLGTITEGLLAVYLTFCSGHSLFSKYLDKKKDKPE
jgi:hypothetical protein